jgi:hypothetical protein
MYSVVPLVRPVRLGVGLLAALLIPPAAARANDTNLPAGGSPKQLSTHRSVSMQSEYVKVSIGDELVTVDCDFTFKNSGPACRVRVGFPDQAGEGDPDAAVPAQGYFRTFRSWVDGKRVSTKVVKSGSPGEVWHVKEVRFPAGATVKVRNRYTVDVGNSVASSPMLVHLAKYVLHTGSSWKGRIGRSVVDVVFTGKKVKGPVRPTEIEFSGETPNYARVKKVDPRQVFYSGPCAPVVSGRTLRFQRKNWRPTEDDDVELVFDMRRGA